MEFWLWLVLCCCRGREAESERTQIGGRSRRFGATAAVSDMSKFCKAVRVRRLSKSGSGRTYDRSNAHDGARKLYKTSPNKKAPI